ncbi:alpha/beta hydrolase [Nocardioides luteus]|uniref:alpha/beta hydrolase n=1 Tax=Nocardioides luteus TaxID=1844 RepID=UPI0018CA5B6E|nr:alpha/beta hydrolase [Nocardioides luteus]MBG6096880.1 acetyl esterase/lipase [Nocardioides luteus]
MTGTNDVYPSTTPRPPFDPEIVPVLEVMREAMPPFTAENLPALRRALAEGLPGVEPTDLTVGGTVQVDERDVPGPDGNHDITLLILTPAGQHGPLPAIYHIHSGGMVVGDRRTQIEMLLPYVAEGLAVVVSVEYRLAPEHPDPAPVEDCYAGLVWTAKNAAKLGIDPGHLIIGGASAGGGLSAGTALLARDRAFPRLTHQILVCPMLDDRLRTPSSRMLDGEGMWDRNDNLFGWTALLGERRGGSDVSPYAAPARAEDLADLPRTYIDTGSAETFRDEALIYAQRLSQAGVSVDFHMWGGGTHGFDLMAAHTQLARASIAARDEFIRRALER